MENVIYIALGLILFTYYYSLGTYFVIKKLTPEKAKKVFLPFFAFTLINKELTMFTLFTIPIKKYARFVLILFLVIILAFSYGYWGNANLPELSRGPLWEIMILVISLCFICFYFSLINSTNKLMLRFNVDKTVVFTLLAVTIVFLPLAYYLLAKKDLRII